MSISLPAQHDPIPPGHRFDVVWRGYDRRQVKDFLEVELRTLVSDRNSATDLVCDLARLLDETRAEMWRLRDSYDRLCGAPLSSAALDERLRRRVEIAEAEAANVVARARVRAEHLRVTAAEEVAETAAAAARRQREVEEDFRVAMAARRTEAARELAEYTALRRAQADRLLRDAREGVTRQVSAAAEQVESLRQLQERLAHRLRSVRGLFLRACALVDPVSPVLGEEGEFGHVRP